MSCMISANDNLITLDSNSLSSIDFDFRHSFINTEEPYSYIFGRSGKEHYRLLRKISDSFDGVQISDVGTNKGLSALSLSNGKNTVRSYDIVNRVDQRVLDISDDIGCEFIICNCLEDEEHRNYILSSDIIFLDTDHDGIFENQFYSFLVDNEFSGVLLLDDIHLNEPMQKFWDSLTQEKHDLTEFGHFTGTGMVLFGGSEND